MTIDYRPKESCAYDIVSLGEVMLRLDPGEGRIHTAREFRAWEGGGEYNVCRGLRRCFGMRAGIITALADIMIGNEEDFTASLGFEVEGVDEKLSALPIDAFKRMIEKVVAAYPNFKAVGTTLRTVHSASINDWGAVCWCDGKFHQAAMRKNLEIMDRVGGGDSFASGFIYGMMAFGDAAKAVEYGAAHGALAMTTPGDTSMATKAEVEKLVGGGGARVDR